VSKTLRRLRIRYEPFGVRRQLSEHRLAYILWRYLERWFRACRPLRASAKKQLREKAAAGVEIGDGFRLGAYTTEVKKEDRAAKEVALATGRIGSDYQPKPTAVGSVFWPCGVINPVLSLFVSPTGNSVAIAGSAQCGRTVWIAVVGMQMDHADSTAMGSDDRLMMICVCKRERAEEREPRG
jgi:hypothetical protein